ncbi:MAG TPA: ABC transporter permease [Candidatus Limnocylindrales bacterium]|jgi:lipopolysaccharide transport system permease protein
MESGQNRMRGSASAAWNRQVVVLEPHHGWRELGLGEIWAHRELLYFFVWRDLKVRYKQTAFGAAWAVLQPVLLMLIFSATLGRLAGVAPAGIPYPLFVFAGLVPWTLFASSLAGASNSLVVGEAIITKVYFPRLLLPFASVGSFLLDFLISLGALAVVMLYFGAVPSLAIVWLPALTLMAVVTALGVGTFLAAVNVRYRDVKYVVPFLVQVWMFASPVVYTSTLIPARWQVLYALNPMTGVVAGFRWALVGGPRPDDLIVVSAVASVLVLVGSLVYFRRVERTFADVI